MLVLKIRDYLMKHPKSSLLELSNEFAMDAASIRDLLKHWVLNGKVDKFTPEICLGKCGCRECNMSAFELYTWK